MPFGCKRARANVLVVDDSPEMQRYLRILLEMDRYQVETASNGAEALRRLRDGCTADLVLLDVEMPVLGGMETLRQLRELRPDLKVIMCSGVDDPHEIGEAVLLGAQAYLVKPIRHLYLSAAVERCLGHDANSGTEHVRARVLTLPQATACRPD